MNIPIWLKRFGLGVSRNSGTILTVLSSSGVVSTALLAIRAKPKADDAMEDLENQYFPEEPPKAEIAKKLAVAYAPCVISAGLTIGMIVGLNHSHEKKRAALAGLYTASELALQEYQQKVKDVIGEKKELALRDEIAKDHICANPPMNREIIITEKGNTKVLDDWTGRYFKSDIATIRDTVNRINAYIVANMWVTLNEVYYELGLPPVKQGNDIGWNIDHMLELAPFSSQIAPDGDPCLVMTFANRPVPYNCK